MPDVRALPSRLVALPFAWLIAIVPAVGQEIDTLPLPDLDLRGVTSYAPAQPVVPLTGLDGAELLLDARLTEDSAPIEQGMVWRVFGAQIGEDGRLPLIATAEGGAARFDLAPGSYLVHGAFGRASASARIEIGTETRRQSMVLNAGGLALDAMLPDGSAMRQAKLRFDIYDTADGDRDLILPDVPPGATVRLPAGTYHVVSRYGAVNATIRADLRVEPGKLTSAEIEHRAAQVTLNLLQSEDGFPLADTAWSVIGVSGDVIAEDVGAYPTMILAAGEYTVIARHRDRIYQRDIDVLAGRDMTIRVMAETDQASTAQ